MHVATQGSRTVFGFTAIARPCYFFGLAGVAANPFAVGWEALALGGWAFFGLPLVSFMVGLSAVGVDDTVRAATSPVETLDVGDEVPAVRRLDR